jgi:hypothetical protein
MSGEDYAFVISVLKRIASSPSDEKLRSLRTESRVVKRAESLLRSVGFRESPDKQWLIFHESEKASLEILVATLQQRADSLLDPETITFAQVAEILKRNGSLPGIKTDIDDSILEEGCIFEETQAPPKPWEINLETVL